MPYKKYKSLVKEQCIIKIKNNIIDVRNILP